MASRHIAAGSLVLTANRERNFISEEEWGCPELKDWTWLGAPKSEGSVMSKEEQSWPHYMSGELQRRFLKTTTLSRFAKLFRQSWISVQFKILDSDPEKGVARIYLLPDDVDRRLIDRKDAKLIETRQLLIKHLDFSEEAWNGVSDGPASQDLPIMSTSDTPDRPDTSLLQLFNEIPPPNPDPDSVLDTYAQDAMVDLLDSRVRGLKTSLYSYQRRSAAAMIEKEFQPKSTLDPRLLHLRDCLGGSWYMNPVSGDVLAEPRTYESIAGGILAEEMGTGKTIICLSVILATRYLPTKAPAIYGVAEPQKRAKVASLMDMAAACTNRNGVPWKLTLDEFARQDGTDYKSLFDSLRRNPGYYTQSAPPPLRTVRTRRSLVEVDEYEQAPGKQIMLSYGTVIIVPGNLFIQWKQEIRKHTETLTVLALEKKMTIPDAGTLVNYDIILFTQARFESIAKEPGGFEESSLSTIHFKRCIIDEGHRLGNSRMSRQSILLDGLSFIQFGSRWIVTGTPSHGLYGTDGDVATQNLETPETSGQQNRETIVQMERKDLERLGAITTLFLKARPWSNAILEAGDTAADWTTYSMLPQHHSRGRSRWENLRTTLNSLIIRHPRSHVRDLLPTVHEKTVVLDGSFQDQLALNLFSMVIVFNAVQSERTDKDYFFHPKQKKYIQQLVSNVKQASFFGGSFFTSEEITSSIEIAEKFLQKGEVPVAPEDRVLLQDAIAFGHLAVSNKLRGISNQFHEMPLSVAGFPQEAAAAWSLGGQTENTFITSASMILALQKLIFKAIGTPEGLNSLLNGGFVSEGQKERDNVIAAAQSTNNSNPQPGTEPSLVRPSLMSGDVAKKPKDHGVNRVPPAAPVHEEAFKGPLEATMLTATASAKLSYLIDGIVRHQEQDKIIIFYENDSVAWYLSATLDVLQIQHLIYAKSLSTERRAQYVKTFHENHAFRSVEYQTFLRAGLTSDKRVLLMDLSQAAFGLDMREASRIYFINPVLNPQVEAQAIGRVRRIHQTKPVFVETLVLRGSIDEVILDRKEHMTQAEHRQAKSILDIRPIYNWIKNAQVSPMPDSSVDDLSEMKQLRTPQPIFGRGFGRQVHPDDGLVWDESPTSSKFDTTRTVIPKTIETGVESDGTTVNGKKRLFTPQSGSELGYEATSEDHEGPSLAERPAKSVKFVP